MTAARHALAGVLLLAAVGSQAGGFEYRIVYLPGTVDGHAVELQPDGTYLDRDNTERLNRLAADDWEVIAITGASGADHAIYLRRPSR